MATVNTARYHHGNLRSELIRIGVDLAAEGGPEAVVLREAARRAEVSSSAAYRHFNGHGELVQAVCRAVATRLRRHMDVGLEEAGGRPETSEALMAVGEAYFRFGLDQPNLYRTMADRMPPPDWGTAGSEDPFALLLELVRLQRPEGESDEVIFPLAVSLWSAVHGYTSLCTGGALSSLPRERMFELLPEVLTPAVDGVGI